jgi:hypothetical protein
MEEMPPFRAREPENEVEAQEAMPLFWEKPDFRAGVARAFSRARYPDPVLLLSKVPETDIWITYVLDHAARLIHTAWIGPAHPPTDA